ncbi:cytochrome b [Thiohalobacter sp. IOR34]|uniref:cytochrome b n=1 Tax=Thiohalobacter sp. IOR34 TaxID=3057176 RepID=UPI0025B06024|nr:cytochrome b [Thiohalobacter sp. IOR34]WJW75482.1 cytochrome b [Thiohalobacter sp. IOR34]
MRLANDGLRYGLIAIVLHWLTAVLVLGLYGLGLYMVQLDYSHRWYQAAPALHYRIGVLLAVLLVLRLGWRLANPRPALIGRPWEQRLALGVHRLFYLLLAGILLSGYLVTTAEGQGLLVVGNLELPALLYGYENQADVAGEIHAWLADVLILLVALHSLAALKHHFIDQDPTLRHMLGMDGD